MIRTEDRLVDYKKLKNIFSNNREVMEQIMMGVILTAHEKAPALKRYYALRDWDALIQTANFIESTYSHVATKNLSQAIVDLQIHVEKRQPTEELLNAIEDTVKLSTYIIQDIEYYLSEN